MGPTIPNFGRRQIGDLGNLWRMTLKQQIQGLVEDLPDDSPLLTEVSQALRMNRAIGEAVDDVREGRTYRAEAFPAKVQQRWPRKACA